jgi:hypothetical protein
MNSGRCARPHDSYLAPGQVGVMDHAANPGRAILPFSADPGHGHAREGVAPVGSDLRGRAAPSHRHDRRVTPRPCSGRSGSSVGRLSTRDLAIHRGDPLAWALRAELLCTFRR